MSEMEGAFGVAKNQELLHGRRIEIQMEDLQQVARGLAGSGDVKDEVTVSMVRIGPDMVIAKKVEARKRVATLEKTFEEVVSKACSQKKSRRRGSWCSAPISRDFGAHF